MASDSSHMKTSRAVRIVAKIKASSINGKLESNPVSFQKTEEESLYGVTIRLADQETSRKAPYKLDYCYGEDEGSNQIFEKEVITFVEGIFRGLNATIVAYGGRDSGKTCIIQGTEEDLGLAPLAMAKVLPMAKEIGGSVMISYYEVHQDRVHDLLETKEKDIRVQEDAGGRIRLIGLAQVQVKSLPDFHKLYFHGSNNRKSAKKDVVVATNRSHKGLIISISALDNNSKIPIVGKMNFVDLAGYEDLKRISNDNPHFTEIFRINKSVCALFNVIRALNANEKYVPYRESKLTRILQDSIGGTSQALMIACLNPLSLQDTVQTLCLACRSCHIASQIQHNSTRKIKSGARPMTTAPLSPLSGRSQTNLKSTMPLSPLSGRSQMNLKHMTTAPLSPLSGRSQTNLKSMMPPSPLSGRSQMNLKHMTSLTPLVARSQNTLKPMTPHSPCVVRSQTTSSAKKPDSFWVRMKEKPTKGRELLDLASPLPNLTEESGSNVPTTEEPLEPKEESSLLNTLMSEKSFQPKEEPCLQKDKNQLEASDAECNIKLLNVPGDSIVDKENRNLSVNFDRSSPPLSSRLREMASSLRSLSSPITINMKTPCQGGHNEFPICADVMEHWTPATPISVKVNDYDEVTNTGTPLNQFSMQSSGLKKSLVQEYLKFLNSASMEELIKIKGIGKKRASYILELREESPEPFKQVSDLEEIGLSSKQINGMLRKVAGELFQC